jgi:hypothetical protein
VQTTTPTATSLQQQQRQQRGGGGGSGKSFLTRYGVGGFSGHLKTLRNCLNLEPGIGGFFGTDSKKKGLGHQCRFCRICRYTSTCEAHEASSENCPRQQQSVGMDFCCGCRFIFIYPMRSLPRIIDDAFVQLLN